MACSADPLDGTYFSRRLRQVELGTTFERRAIYWVGAAGTASPIQSSAYSTQDALRLTCRLLKDAVEEALREAQCRFQQWRQERILPYWLSFRAHRVRATGKVSTSATGLTATTDGEGSEEEETGQEANDGLHQKTELWTYFDSLGESLRTGTDWWNTLETLSDEAFGSSPQGPTARKSVEERLKTCENTGIPARPPYMPQEGDESHLEQYVLFWITLFDQSDGIIRQEAMPPQQLTKPTYGKMSSLLCDLLFAWCSPKKTAFVADTVAGQGVGTARSEAAASSWAPESRLSKQSGLNIRFSHQRHDFVLTSPDCPRNIRFVKQGTRDCVLRRDCWLLLLDAFLGANTATHQMTELVGRGSFPLGHLLHQVAEQFAGTRRYECQWRPLNPLKTAREAVHLMLLNDRHEFWSAFCPPNGEQGTHLDILFSLVVIPHGVHEFLYAHPEWCPTAAALEEGFPLHTHGSTMFDMPAGQACLTDSGRIATAWAIPKPPPFRRSSPHCLYHGMFSSRGTREVLTRFLTFIETKMTGLLSELELRAADVSSNKRRPIVQFPDEVVVDPKIDEELAPPGTVVLHWLCFFLQRYTVDLIRREELGLLRIICRIICRLASHHHNLLALSGSLSFPSGSPHHHQLILLQLAYRSFLAIATEEGNLTDFALKRCNSHQVIALLVETALKCFDATDSNECRHTRESWQLYLQPVHAFLAHSSAGVGTNRIQRRRRKIADSLEASGYWDSFRELFSKGHRHSRPVPEPLHLPTVVVVVLSYLPLPAFAAMSRCSRAVSCALKKCAQTFSVPRQSERVHDDEGNHHQSPLSPQFAQYAAFLSWCAVQEVVDDHLGRKGQREDQHNSPFACKAAEKAGEELEEDEDTPVQFLEFQRAFMPSLWCPSNKNTANSTGVYSTTERRGGDPGSFTTQLGPSGLGGFAPMLPLFSQYAMHSLPATTELEYQLRRFVQHPTYWFCLPHEPQSDLTGSSNAVHSHGELLFQLGRFWFGTFLHPQWKWKCPTDFILETIVLILPPTIQELPSECLAQCKLPALNVTIVGQVSAIGDAVFPSGSKAMTLRLDRLVGVKKVGDLFLANAKLKWLALPPFEPSTTVGHGFMTTTNFHHQTDSDHRVKSENVDFPIDFRPLRNIIAVGHDAFSFLKQSSFAEAILQHLDPLESIGENFFLGSAVTTLRGSVFGGPPSRYLRQLESRSNSIDLTTPSVYHLQGFFALSGLGQKRNETDTKQQQQHPVALADAPHVKTVPTTSSCETSEEREQGEELRLLLEFFVHLKRLRGAKFIGGSAGFFVGCRYLSAFDEKYFAEFLALTEPTDGNTLRIPMLSWGGTAIESIDCRALCKLLPAPIQHVGRGFLLGSYALLRVVNLDVLAPALSVNGIPDEFLSGCCSLESISLDALCTVNKIGKGFLAGCASLKTVDLSRFTQVEMLGSRFLSCCLSLEVVNLEGFAHSLNKIGHDFLSSAQINSLPHSPATALDLRPLHRLLRIPYGFLSGSRFHPPSVDLSGLASVQRIDSSFLDRTNIEVVDLSTWHSLESIGHSFLEISIALQAVRFSRQCHIKDIGEQFLMYVNPRRFRLRGEQGLKTSFATFDFDWFALRFCERVPQSFMCSSVPSTLELECLESVTNIGDNFLTFFPSEQEAERGFLGDALVLDHRTGVLTNPTSSRNRNGKEGWRLDLQHALAALTRVETVGDNLLACRPVIETEAMISFSPLKNLISVGCNFLANLRIQCIDLHGMCNLDTIGNRCFAFCTELKECHGMGTLLLKDRTLRVIGSECFLECKALAAVVAAGGPCAMELQAVQNSTTASVGSDFLAVNHAQSFFEGVFGYSAVFQSWDCYEVDAEKVSRRFRFGAVEWMTRLDMYSWCGRWTVVPFHSIWMKDCYTLRPPAVNSSSAGGGVEESTVGGDEDTADSQQPDTKQDTVSEISNEYDIEEELEKGTLEEPMPFFVLYNGRTSEQLSVRPQEEGNRSGETTDTGSDTGTSSEEDDVVTERQRQMRRLLPPPRGEGVEAFDLSELKRRIQQSRRGGGNRFPRAE